MNHQVKVENYLAQLSPTGQTILQALANQRAQLLSRCTGSTDAHIIYNNREKTKQDKILTFGSKYNSPPHEQDGTSTRAGTGTINWDNMFDTECFPNVGDIDDVVITPPSTFNNILSIDQALGFNKKPSKRACSHVQSDFIDINKTKTKISKKQENKSMEILCAPISCRKRVYTETVSSWLQNNRDANWATVDNIHSNDNTELKKKNKVVQTRLANKGGIMKFDKPNKKQDVNDKLETVEEVAVAGPRPQLSHNNVVLLSEDTCTTFQSHFTEHRVTLTLVLIYSGCCQLTRRNLDDTEIEGLLIHLKDSDIYYFIRCATELPVGNIKETLETTLPNVDIICYEAKYIFIYLREQLNLDIDIRKLSIFDAKIAGSLVDADTNIDKFETLLKMEADAGVLCANTSVVLDVVQESGRCARLLETCVAVLNTSLTRDNLMDLFVNIEMKVAPIIADMESGGVLVDLSALNKMEGIINEELQEAERACHRAAGRHFQVSSSVQVRRVLYEELQLRPRGRPSTCEVELRGLAACHPLPELVLRYRQLSKARSTFLAGVAMQESGGRVRPAWVQTAASTGRIASNNPNLQAIPKTPYSLSGTADTRELRFRSVYVSGAGRSLLSADFRHLELRILAHMTRDPKLLQVFALSDDVFQSLAATWLQKSPSGVSPEERERSKRVVYAALYGAGTRKLMEILQLTYERTLDVLASFNRSFPCVREFCSSVVSESVSRGCYAVSLCGRRRHLQLLESPHADERARARRQAVNFVLQGSAADLCKAAMVATDGVSNGARLLLQIHDELLWELDDRHFHTTAEMVKEAMETCGRQYGVQEALPVTLSRGTDWGHMTPI